MTDQKKEIAELLSGMIDSLETGDIESMIEIPPESKLGDYAFPCFKLAKTMRKAPNLIAQELAEKLAGDRRFFRFLRTVAKMMERPTEKGLNYSYI